MSGWQDIATAPRDGTWLLLACADGNRTCGHWHATFTYEWSDVLQEGVDVGAWSDLTVADWGMQEYTRLEPTHWQPLPDAPEPPPSAITGAGEQ